MKYLEVYNTIKHSIKTGIYAPYAALPKITELAKIHKVAYGTILHALRLLKKEGLVKSVPSQGVFVHDHANINLFPEDNKIRRIALLTPYMISRVVRNPYFMEIMWGVENILRDHGAHLHLISGKDKPFQEILRQINVLEINGLIAVEYENKETCKVLESLHMPLVYVENIEFSSQKPIITASNHQGGIEAVKKLHALGHRKILFLNGMDPDLKRPEKMGVFRFKGIMEEVKKHQNIQLARAVVSLHRDQYSPETKSALKKHSDYTGIIVSTFLLAEAIQEYFEETRKSNAAGYDFIIFELYNEPFFIGNKAAHFCRWDGILMGNIAAETVLAPANDVPKITYLPMFITDNADYRRPQKALRFLRRDKQLIAASDKA